MGFVDDALIIFIPNSISVWVCWMVSGGVFPPFTGCLLFIPSKIRSLICKKSVLGFCGPFVTSLLDLFLTASDDLLNITIFFPLISSTNTLIISLPALSWLRSSAQFPWVTNISRNYELPNCNTNAAPPQQSHSLIMTLKESKDSNEFPHINAPEAEGSNPFYKEATSLIS